VQLFAFAPDQRFDRICLVRRIHAHDLKEVSARIEIAAALQERPDLEVARLHFNGRLGLEGALPARDAHQQLHSVWEIGRGSDR
jgi:hypothetical protein